MPASSELLVSQEHGRSTTAFLSWGGEIAVTGYMESEALSGSGELVYDDMISGLREMLATDQEFRSYLNIDDVKVFNVKNDRPVSANGELLAEVVANGRRNLEPKVATRPELQAQLTRCIGDEMAIQAAENLAVGQSYVTISMEPKEELNSASPKIKETYKDFGYLEGLSYYQWWTREDEHTFVGGSFSVDLSDEKTHRELRADMGFPLPEDATPNTMIRHGFVVDVAAEEAEQLVRNMRTDYYRRRGETKPRQSVSEYVRQNEDIVKQYFRLYYPAISKATRTGINEPELMSFAQAILSQQPEKLNREIRENLSSIAISPEFNQEFAKTMDAALRYAIAEELRKGLPKFLGLSSIDRNFMYSPSVYTTTTQPDRRSIYIVNEQLAYNIFVGVSAGRSYGGCSATDLGEEEATGLIDASRSSHTKQRESAISASVCVEIKDGQKTNCPFCKKSVTAKVPEKGGSVYCSNTECDKALPGLIGAAPRPSVSFIYSYNR